jgi:hypothetical protein
MRWQRWSDWRAGDPRWRVHVVDTTERGAEEVARALSDWIDDERACLRDGKHPLADWAKRIRLGLSS